MITRDLQELAFRLNNYFNRNFIILQCYERLKLNYESIRYFTNKYEEGHIGIEELKSCSQDDIVFLNDLLTSSS